MNLPDKKYNIIYADPAWEYDDKALAGDRGAGCKYSVMSIEELKALPVQSIADNDCILFMWVTFPKLQEGLDLIQAWGFIYKTVAFTWIKKSGIGTYYVGMGSYTRANAEIVLLATKGKLKRIDGSVKQIIESTPKQHSQKPNIVRDKIIQLYGDLPRIELFARTKIHGWDIWGNDEKLKQNPLESFLK